MSSRGADPSDVRWNVAQPEMASGLILERLSVRHKKPRMGRIVAYYLWPLSSARSSLSLDLSAEAEPGFCRGEQVDTHNLFFF